MSKRIEAVGGVCVSHTFAARWRWVTALNICCKICDLNGITEQEPRRDHKRLSKHGGESLAPFQRACLTEELASSETTVALSAAE